MRGESISSMHLVCIIHYHVMMIVVVVLKRKKGKEEIVREDRDRRYE